MEAIEDAFTWVYAVEPVDSPCADCQRQSSVRVIVLPPAVVAARAPRPVHISVFRPDPNDDDDLANATWEDAAWQ